MANWPTVGHFLVTLSLNNISGAARDRSTGTNSSERGLREQGVEHPLTVSTELDRATNFSERGLREQGVEHAAVILTEDENHDSNAKQQAPAKNHRICECCKKQNRHRAIKPRTTR